MYQWAEQGSGALNHSRIPLAEKVQNETARDIWDALDVRLDLIDKIADPWADPLVFLFPSSRASRSCRAPREISRSPRLAHNGSNFNQSRLRKAILPLAADREMNTVRPNYFLFFSRFPSSIRQEIPLLVYLDPVDCIDPRIFTVSWFLVFIFIVLCSTFQYGCSFWVVGVIFEIGLFRLTVFRLVYFSQNFEEKILIFHSPPRPRYRYRVIFHLKLVTCV